LEASEKLEVDSSIEEFPVPKIANISYNLTVSQNITYINTFSALGLTIIACDARARVAEVSNVLSREGETVHINVVQAFGELKLNHHQSH
jgi:hypothetical protein